MEAEKGRMLATLLKTERARVRKELVVGGANRRDQSMDGLEEGRASQAKGIRRGKNEFSE